MSTDLNNFTLAVVNLSRSIEFYVALPSFRVAEFSTWKNKI